MNLIIGQTFKVHDNYTLEVVPLIRFERGFSCGPSFIQKSVISKGLFKIFYQNFMEEILNTS